MDQELEARNKLVFGYAILRSVIGIMGVALPFVVAIGGWLVFGDCIQDSISSYYHTGMRDVFVGATWAIGFFLFAYQGYTRQDNWASNLACIFAVLLATFPTAPEEPYSDLVKWISYFHLACAAGFFVTLTFIAWRQFTKSGKDRDLTEKKRLRNRVYRACGIIMIVCLALIVLISLSEGLRNSLDAYSPLFWLETAAIIAFGVSWLTKGEALRFLNDPKSEGKTQAS